MIKQAIMPLNDYVDICDKIREKTEIEDVITSGELSEKIDAVYEAGQAQGEREMWDYILDYGAKYDFNKAFSQTGFEYIRPPYKIIPTYNYSLNQTFVEAKKLKKVEAAYFDFSKKQRGGSSQTGLYWTFATCPALEEVEDIGLQPDYSLSSTFVWCGKLKKIAMVRVDENTLYDDPFNGCGNLEDIRFEGVIGQNGLNFRWNTKLTYDSCHSIFTHLKDFRTTIVENYADADTGNRPYELATHALTEGDKYCLICESDNAIYKAEATVQSVNVAVSGVSAMGLQFEFPQEEEGEVPLAWVYQDGEKLMYDSYFYRPNGKFTLIKGATETRTITMPKAVKDNGNATPEDIAEATERGWTIAWKE